MGSPIADDLSEAIRRMKLELRESPMLAPGTMLLVSPPDFRSLLSFAPEPTIEWGDSLMSIAWRARSTFDVFTKFPRSMVMLSDAFGGPTSYELRMGPYEDVAEPWCVVKNLDTGRREVHDWPLPNYVADHLVDRRAA